MNTDDRSAGTELIYQLINNSNICTIKVSNKNETTYADINLASMSELVLIQQLTSLQIMKNKIKYLYMIKMLMLLNKSSQFKLHWHMN